MKAAIYARTAQQEQSTISQIDLCRAYIHEKGGKVTGIYDDEGVSAHNENRDGLITLMNDAVEQKFDTIVITGYDRLFREPNKINEFQIGLGQLNIKLLVTNSL